MSAPDSRFLRACKQLSVDATPIWLMRQAGRYMAEYRAVRKRHSLLEICKDPALAAEVTITAAEKLGVDAAIIFADLLLPLEVMGLDFHFSAGEGPVISQPLRSAEAIAQLRTDRAADLGYVADAVRGVATHFGARLPVIGFCGAPFTLASYMIEGGGSRHYIHTKKMMYSSPAAWSELMRKLVAVLSEYAAEQARAGADALQVFDSWVGCLSPQDYRKFVLPQTKILVQNLRRTGVPVIYFGTDTTTLLAPQQHKGFAQGVVRADELAFQAQLAAELKGPGLFREKRVGPGFNHAAAEIFAAHNAAQPGFFFKETPLESGPVAAGLFKVVGRAQT